MSNIDLGFGGSLPEINGICLADTPADIAFALFELQAAVVNVSHKGNGLGKIDMNRLVHGNILVEWIRIFNGAVFHTGGTARTFVFNDIPGPGFQGNLEITFLPFYCFDFCKCENLNVWMPADLDQFR